MKDYDLWKFVQSKILSEEIVYIIFVVHADGSSPGKQGFKMALSGKGVTYGTIGGGAVEYKIIKDLLQRNKELINGTLLIKSALYPDCEESVGMICSGEQTEVTVLLTKEDINLITNILDSIKSGIEFDIELSSSGLKVIEPSTIKEKYSFSEHENNWKYNEKCGLSEIIYIFGSGHVGLKLSEIMKFLGFYVVVIDNRNDADTFTKNTFADEKILSDYSNSEKLIREGDNSYIVIVTHGHKYDKEILNKIIGLKSKYIGMIGSKNKVKSTFDTLLMEGVSESNLRKVKAPIGLPINSKSAEEIAISIAAEIIKIKNSE